MNSPVLQPRPAPPRLAFALEQQGVHPLLARLLAARGVGSAEELDTSPARLLPPPTMKGAPEAGRLLADAIAAGRRICIVADYDCDGATACAVALRGLRLLGAASVSYVVPDRAVHGYGLTPAIVELARPLRPDLLVTVDNGIASLEGVAHAKGLGMAVLVTDHHLPRVDDGAVVLPAADVIVNPNQPGCGFASKAIAGVGVMFYVLLATRAEQRARGLYAAGAEPRLDALLDLVALGTVADVAALRGLNRAFVTQGLKVMRGRANIGLAALADASRLARAPIARDLGFALGPRVNAGGRVGQADLGVRLLTTHDAAEAAGIAAQLDALNHERRAIEQAVTDAALSGACLSPGCTIVSGEGWHPGVIGIVASRLKEKMGRPAIVIAIQDDGIAKGSGRSITGVDLGAAVLAAKDHGLLMAGGGHAMAAGLTVAADGIAALDEFLNERLAAQVAAATAEKSLSIDAAVAPRGLNAGLVDVLEAGGPYGQGWPSPRIAAGPFRVVDARVVGENHLRLQLSGVDGGRIKAMAWRQGDSELGAALQGAGARPLHIAGRVKRDDWTGGDAVELELDDAAFAG